MGTNVYSTHVIYGPLVHASGVQGWLNMVHGGQKMWKIAQNGRKCAHSWLRQMRHMPDLDRSVPQDWYQVICVQHIFWASPNSSGFGNGRVAK